MVDAGEKVQETMTASQDELSAAPHALPLPTPQAEENRGLEPSPIDMLALDRLQEIVGGEPAYLYELIDSFLEDSPQCVFSLRQGLENGDAKRIHLAAHTLKANSAEFGAERLRELNRELEELAITGTLEEAPDLVTAIEQEYVLVQRALQTVRGE
jgi:HPt (histidine-containing phosphotransfer) domain-containing protein